MMLCDDVGCRCWVLALAFVLGVGVGCWVIMSGVGVACWHWRSC